MRVALSAHARGFALTLACALVCAPACLPADTRPPPSQLDVMFVGSPLVAQGIPASSFTDAWSVSFDRVLVTVGQPGVVGDACTAYNEADYTRIFDGSVVSPQRVSTLYGLGTCGFTWRVRNPDVDSLLTQNVTQDDKVFLITPGEDAYTSGATGISLYLKGNATNGALTKTFAWSFRSRRVYFHDCILGDGQQPISLSLSGNGDSSTQIELHPEVLFADRLDWRSAKLRFQPFADADDKFGDANGEITLDELGKMTTADAGVTTDDLMVGDSGPSAFTTFEDFVYLGLFPKTSRLTGTVYCSSEIRSSRE